MALNPLPLRQGPRPGTGDDRYASTYSPAAGWWTGTTPAPVAETRQPADDRQETRRG